MRDHPPYARDHAAQSSHGSCWEQWVPVLVPASLALLLALAIVAAILVADPSAGPGEYQYAQESWEMFAEPAPATR